MKKSVAAWLLIICMLTSAFGQRVATTGAGKGSPPAPDTTPPVVSIIAPAADATVANTLTIVADANDNRGVVSVQFKVDGVNLGSADATCPFSMPWVTTDAADGPHTLSAVAKDAANNTATATINVTVANGAPAGDTLLLADDFDDNLLDATKWTTGALQSVTFNPAVTVAESSQRYNWTALVANGTGANYNGITSASAYDLTGGYAYVSVPTPPSPSTATVALQLMLLNAASPANNHYRFSLEANGQYFLQARINGSTSLLAAGTYDSTAMRFIRIRHDAQHTPAQVVFESAPASGGAPGNWTPLYSGGWSTWNGASGVDQTNVRFEIRGGTFGSEASPGTLAIDNFKAAQLVPTADSTPPVVSVTNPANGSTVSSTATLRAAASDDSGVKDLRYQVDNTNVGNVLTSAPYTFAWNTALVSDGAHTVRAIATDVNGNSTTSSSFSVTVNNAPVNVPPQATLSANLTSGAAPLAVTFTGSGSDQDGTVASYSLNFGEGTPIASASGSHTYSSAGSYTATLTVTDNLGATGSASVNVSVGSAPPPPPPAGGAPDLAELPRVFLTANDTLDTTGWPVVSGGSTMAGLQAAVNSAAMNTVITVTAGIRYVGNLVLPIKARTSTQWIVFRSTEIGSLPAATRVAGDAHMAILSNPVGGGQQYGQGEAVLSTATGSSPNSCGGYRFEGVAFEMEPGVTLCYNHVNIGSTGPTQDTVAEVPKDFVFDRCYFAPNQVSETYRNEIDAVNISVIHSRIEGYGHDQQDTQALASWNSPGPFRVYNNFIEGAGENTIWGGADSTIPDNVQSDIDVRHNTYFKRPEWIDGILLTPPQPSASAVSGGSLAASTSYTYKVVQRGRFGYSDVAPFYRIISSKASAARTVSTTGANKAVQLSWNRAAHVSIWNPIEFNIYRSADGGTTWVYLTYVPSNPAASSYAFTDDGTAAATAVSGSTPAVFNHGALMSIKNIFELKAARRVLVEENLFWNHWGNLSQQGPAILFTPQNQSGGNPWNLVADVTFQYNILRHSPDGISTMNMSYEHGPSLGTQRLTIRYNVFEDMDYTYAKIGNPTDGIMFTMLSGGNAPSYPTDVLIDHNTWVGPKVGRATLFASPYNNDTQFPNFARFQFTNNLVSHGYWGFFGVLTINGTPTLQKYFPDVTPTSQRFTRNVFIGPYTDYGPWDFSGYVNGASQNYFESSAASVGFTNYSGGKGGNYVLNAPGSLGDYRVLATDGTAIGAPVALVYSKCGVPLP